jgi:hypothetical protein
MPTIPVDALPSPGAVSITEEPVVLRSDPRTGIVHTRALPVGTNRPRPRTYELSYSTAPAEIASALRMHYEQHGRMPFAFRAPDGTDEQVIWRSLQIRRGSNRTISATAELERVIAIGG